MLGAGFFRDVSTGTEESKGFCVKRRTKNKVPSRKSRI